MKQLQSGVGACGPPRVTCSLDGALLLVACVSNARQKDGEEGMTREKARQCAVRKVGSADLEGW
jgi:hypothetical protein